MSTGGGGVGGSGGVSDGRAQRETFARAAAGLRVVLEGNILSFLEPVDQIHMLQVVDLSLCLSLLVWLLLCSLFVFVSACVALTIAFHHPVAARVPSIRLFTANRKR